MRQPLGADDAALASVVLLRDRVQVKDFTGWDEDEFEVIAAPVRANPRIRLLYGLVPKVERVSMVD